MKKLIVPLIVIVFAGVMLWFLLKPDEAGRTIGIITFVDHPVLNTIQKSFQEKLQKLVGTDYEINFLVSNAQGRTENLQNISRNVLRRKPDVVVTISTPVSQALMREADAEQKIVYTFVTNPSDLGDELTRTNSTGLSDAVNYSANIHLIETFFGREATIGMLYNPNEDNSVHGINAVESIMAKSHAEMELMKATVVRETDIPTATAQIASRVDVIYVGGDNTVVGAIETVGNEALRKSVPVFASDEGSITSVAIAGFSVDYRRLGVETAVVVKQILDGREPREVPRITLKGDKLIVNQAAAKRWNFSIPQEVLEKADQIIE